MGYNEELGHSQLPGVSDAVEQTQKVYKYDNQHCVFDGVRIHKDTDDEGNTGAEWKLRPGLALVLVINGGPNDGMYVDLDHADAPANNDVTDVVILDEWVDLKDKTGTRQNVQAKVLVHGQVKNDEIEYNSADATRRHGGRSHCDRPAHAVAGGTQLARLVQVVARILVPGIEGQRPFE